MAFRRLLSRELVANCTDSSLKLDSSPISHTHPLQLNSHKYKEMIEEITIKFGTELKPTKASWKSQLYINVLCVGKQSTYTFIGIDLNVYEVF